MQRERERGSDNGQVLAIPNLSAKKATDGNRMS